jgi:hypothetical protein
VSVSLPERTQAPGPTALGNALAVGAPAKVRGVAQARGAVKAGVETCLTGDASN